MNKKRVLSAALGFAFTLLLIFNSNLIFSVVNTKSEYINDNNLEKKNLKFSKLSGKIHVDNNWSATKSAGICTGFGNYSDPYVIEDLVIDAGGSGVGIFIQNSIEYFRIENCTIYNAETGIYLGNFAHNGTVIGNNCSNNIGGIEVADCMNCTISGNYANYNTNNGIALWYGTNNIISGNTANNNEFGIAVSDTEENNISGNTANNNNNSGIHLKNCTEITISGNNADENDAIGMYLEICRNIDVIENDVNDNGWVGMYLGNFSDCTVINNTINNNDDAGMSLEGNRNLISENTINYNNYSGININWGNNNNFTKNIANYNAEHGISLGGGYSLVSENIFNHNDQYGIYVSDVHNNVTRNTARFNDEYGISLDGSVSDCILYLNNITGNFFGSARDDGTNNQWDNGTIGHYWEEYNGKDVDDDGIGDTPYTIPGTAGSQDNYPIWWDAPNITIISPNINETFGETAPEYNISLEGVPLAMWYTVEGVNGTFNITELTGAINQTVWKSLTEGEIVITFYAQDSRDEIVSKSVTVVKRIPEGIPGYNLFILLGVLSVVTIVITKKIKK